MTFEFATAQRIVFGSGVVRQTGALASALGQRPLVVTGRRVDRAETVLASLRASGLAPEVFSVSEEPTTSLVESGVKHAKSCGCDLVIGCGGGSALDAGKAISAMLTNPGELLDYLEVIGRGQSIKQAPAPFIAIPTTAGTGSEATRNAVLASAEHRVKVSLRSPLMLPSIALVDPELTHGLPADVTAATGLDALTQLLEPFVCSRSNPMVDALCREGLMRAGRSLRKACQEPSNASARVDMALASLFGGIALANAGLGVVHGFAGPIGGMFPAPHGAVCAALLPHACRVNIRALQSRQPDSPVLGRYAEAAAILTGQAGEAADTLTDYLARLIADLKIPRLGLYSLQQRDVPEVVEKAMRASSMKANPIALTHEELTEILEAAR
jgi:alcohol dehydrogenase class IV